MGSVPLNNLENRYRQAEPISATLIDRTRVPSPENLAVRRPDADRSTRPREMETRPSLAKTSIDPRSTSTRSLIEPAERVQADRFAIAREHPAARRRRTPSRRGVPGRTRLRPRPRPRHGCRAGRKGWPGSSDPRLPDCESDPQLRSIADPERLDLGHRIGEHPDAVIGRPEGQLAGDGHLLVERLGRGRRSPAPSRSGPAAPSARR